MAIQPLPPGLRRVDQAIAETIKKRPGAVSQRDLLVSINGVKEARRLAIVLAELPGSKHGINRDLRTDIDFRSFDDGASEKRTSSQRRHTLIHKVFLSIGLYLLLFLNQPNRELFFQLGGLLFIALSAASAVLSRGIQNHQISVFESSLIVTTILSLIVSLLSENNYSSTYSILFACVCGAIFVLVRSVTLSEIISAAAYAYIGMLVTIWATSITELALSLSMNQPNRWELRFQPFSLQANLVGFMFGGGSAILLMKAASVVGLRRLIFLVAAISCVPLILAASARASLLALLFACLGVTGLNLRYTKYTIVILFLSIVVISLNADAIYTYLDDILELSSETRGFESGGSGRFELWQLGISHIFADGIQFLFGSGLRSASAEFLGFQTENSYITILIESGFISGFFLIATILLLLKKLITQKDKNNFYIINALKIFIIFIIIESIFNRYLIAIGNPLSLLFLIVCAKIAVSNSLEFGPNREFRTNRAAGRPIASIAGASQASRIGSWMR